MESRRAVWSAALLVRLLVRLRLSWSELVPTFCLSFDLLVWLSGPLSVRLKAVRPESPYHGLNPAGSENLIIVFCLVHLSNSTVRTPNAGCSARHCW